MTVQTQTDIVSDILSHMAKCGGPYRTWYVGISSDPRKRLFQEHGVNEKMDSWIIRTATSSTIARAIESYFVNEIGTDGGTGGGDYSSCSVYAYKKNAHTQP
jgi:hypothetical protein